MIHTCNDQEIPSHQKESLNFFPLVLYFSMPMETVRREQIGESSFAFIYHQHKRHVLCLCACKLPHAYSDNALRKWFHIGLAEHALDMYLLLPLQTSNYFTLTSQLNIFQQQLLECFNQKMRTTEDIQVQRAEHMHFKIEKMSLYVGNETGII